MPRNSKNKNKRAMKNAKKFVYNQRILSKILKENVVNYHFGFRKCNEHEAHIGQQELSWTNTHMPLDIINLNSVINTNGSTVKTGIALKALQDDGYQFTDIENTTLLNKYGGTLTDTVDSFRSLVYRWSKINICLWADTLRSTMFKIYLVRIKDPILDPYDDTINSSSAEVQDARKQVFQQFFLSDQTSSPIVPKTKIAPSLMRKFDIVWKKQYLIDEQQSTVDQRPHRIVKLFRRADRKISYQRNESLNYGSMDNPEQPSTVNNDANKRAYPAFNSQQLFLIITANCTLNEAEDGSNYHKATYDIIVDNKYSTMTFEQ